MQGVPQSEKLNKAYGKIFFAENARCFEYNERILALKIGENSI